MKVSIIMGMYNCENTLNDSLNSLVAQTFQDFEIILCDDGSQDQTVAIATTYKKIWKERLIIIKNISNRGLAHSLNRCLEIADGEYIARMDADDIAKYDRLEMQVEYLQRNPSVDLVGSSVLLFDEDGIWGQRNVKEKPVKKDFLRTSQFVHPTIMIRKSVLNELGGYRVEKATLRAEDYDLFMRFYAKGYKGTNILEPLLLYREDTATFKRRAYRNRVDEMKVRYSGFKELGLLPYGLPYVIKPLLVGLIPQRTLKILRHERFMSS